MRRSRRIVGKPRRPKVERTSEAKWPQGAAPRSPVLRLEVRPPVSFSAALVRVPFLSTLTDPIDTKDPNGPIDPPRRKQPTAPRPSSTRATVIVPPRPQWTGERFSRPAQVVHGSSQFCPHWPRELSGNYCYQESRFRTFGLRKRRPAFNARKHWLNPTSAIAARLGGGSQLS